MKSRTFKKKKILKKVKKWNKFKNLPLTTGWCSSELLSASSNEHNSWYSDLKKKESISELINTKAVKKLTSILINWIHILWHWIHKLLWQNNTLNDRQLRLNGWWWIKTYWIRSITKLLRRCYFEMNTKMKKKMTSITFEIQNKNAS